MCLCFTEKRYRIYFFSVCKKEEINVSYCDIFCPCACCFRHFKTLASITFHWVNTHYWKHLSMYAAG